LIEGNKLHCTAMEKSTLIILLVTFGLLNEVCGQHRNAQRVKHLLKLSKRMNKKLDYILDGGPVTNTNEAITHEGASIPEHFDKVSSFEFVVNGEVHAQETHHDEDTGDLILTSPAHSGYPDTTTVISSKNSSEPAKMMSCSDSLCHLSDLHDELALHPQNILKHRTRHSRRVRVENKKIVNVIRSNHRLLSINELESLSENMKHVSDGRMILTSDSEVITGEPINDFNMVFSDVADDRAGTGCKLRQGCVDVNSSCTWSFDVELDNVTGQVIPHKEVNVHGIAYDRYCTFCCRNNASFPDNDHVLCEDLEKTTDRYRSAQAFLTGVAETNHDENGEYKCFGKSYWYNTWNENCCIFSRKFGACVKNDGECCMYMNNGTEKYPVNVCDPNTTNYCPPTTTTLPTNG